MVSYRELICFIWQFVRQQKWSFVAILFLTALTWPLDVLLWPYIMHLIVDIFSHYEADRLAAWSALKGPIIGGICLIFSVEIASRTMGFLMARAIPKLQATMRMTMFDHIQHHSPRYVNERFAAGKTH